MSGFVSLIGAVIRQAVDDLASTSPKIRSDAEAFFSDGRLEIWLEGTGVDPDAVHRMMPR